jgi:hypothetical protein
MNFNIKFSISNFQYTSHIGYFKSIRYVFSIFIIILLANSCANIVAPTGGERDKTSPKIVQTKSTPNLQTNFKKQPIVLTFDEWIKLEDVFNQVVVSPPLNERPEVVLRGKKVLFNFSENEVLRENATYTINFGDAVKDNNEGNIAKDLRFVFSTGPTIDSLEVTGAVVDALTGEPVENALIMLYDNLSDTVVKKLKPFYFGKTDKQGFTRIQNVRPDTFKVFALKDNDVNYLYNQENEKIGFPNDFLILTEKNAAPTKIDTAVLNNDSLKLKADSIAAANSDLRIRLFDPRKPLKMQTRDVDKYGVAKVIYNQDAKNAIVTFDNIGQNTLKEISKDTVLIWYDKADDTPWNIYAQGEKQTDTIRVRPRGRADFLKKNRLEPLGNTSNFLKHPLKSFYIDFNFPIKNIDSQRLILTDTSKKNIPLSIKRDTASPRRLYFETSWQEGMRYDMTILPSAFTAIYDFKNDTIKTGIIALTKKDFGDIILDISDMDSTKSYICQLLSNGGVIEAEFFIDNLKKFNKKIETVPTGKYIVKIIEDLNRNRQWDTGDYTSKSQPERIFLKQTEQDLRALWGLEIPFEIPKK